MIGALAGYVFFVAIEKGFKAVRGVDGLGRGDAKLLAAGGAWCGWYGLPFIILLASFGGLIFAAMPSVRKQKTAYIAFGPFLAIGIMITWITRIFVGA